MNNQEVTELHTYDILSCKDDSAIQILKKINDGYLVLEYSTCHNVFNVVFISFADIVNYGYETTDYYDDDFCGTNIRSIDKFGYCKPIK